MKYLRFILFGVLILVVASLFAAANGTTSNTPVYVAIGPAGSNYVLFYGTTPATTASDSIGIHYTKAMYIADFNQTEYVYFYLNMYDSDTGYEDCNVTVQYSYDLTNWVSGSANSGVIQDSLHASAVTDTLNVINGSSDTNFHIYPYMRLKFDYQAGNPIGTYVTWKIRLVKPIELDYPRKNSLIVSTS